MWLELFSIFVFELEEEESKAAAAGPTWKPGQLLQAGAASAYLSSQLLFQAADTEQLGAHKGAIQPQPRLKYQQMKFAPTTNLRVMMLLPN